MPDGKRQKKCEGNEERGRFERNGPMPWQKAAFWKRPKKDGLEIWASKGPRLGE